LKAHKAVRGFSTLVLSACFAGTLFASPAWAGTEWNVSLWGNSRAVTVAIEYLANEIEKRTNGDFRMVIHFGESISPARDNIDGISLGVFEAAHICPSYHPGKTPALLALELPFLPFNDIQAAHQVALKAHHHPVIEAELAQFNARVLQHVIAPRYEFMGRGEPPIELAMWQGKRVRAPGAIGEGVRALGGRPTSVPAPEIYTSLERRLFDAAALPFSYTFASYRIHEVSDWYTFNMNLAIPSCAILVNRDAWAALPEEYRALIEEINVEAYRLQFDALADTAWLPEFDQAGLTRIEYDADILAEFKKSTAQPLWEEWVKRNGRRFAAQDYLDFILSEAAIANAAGS
jgi:TRAP-type C4-dicarboxylate transport system substrate-binding protein